MLRQSWLPRVWSAAVLAGLWCGFSAAACNAPNNSPGSPTPTVTGVLVLPRQTTLDPGRATKLVAEQQFSDGSHATAAAVSWTTSAAGVASVALDGTVTGVRGGVATITATTSGHTSTATVTVRDLYDVDGQGAPTLVTSDYIDLSRVERVSRFRSGIGHDYSDAVESCRSMKHYFMPKSGTDWSTVVISAPADGVISDIRAEQTFASQVHIQPTVLSAATIVLFHVVPDAGIAVGATVSSGQRLGRHVGAQTMSDVAIRLQDANGLRYVSYFEAMTDAVFDRYRARGIGARAAFVISRTERDTSPLSCSGEQFLWQGSLPNWVTLN